MIKTFLTLFLALWLTACASLNKPIIEYRTETVKVPVVATLPQEPQLEPFISSVKNLSDTSSDGEVAKSYKTDLLILMKRDSIYSDFFTKYRKAREANEQARTSGTAN